EAFREPAFGTCVVRVTEHDAEPPRGFARNDYSRRQPFNADDTRLIVADSQGGWYLYDAATLEPLGLLPGLAGDAEPQWDPKDPDRLYYLPRNGVGMKLHELRVAEGSSRVAADFGERLRRIWPDAAAAWTRSEGSPSADLRYWAFQVDDAQWRGVGLFTYDLKTDTILATYDLRRNGRPRPDHLSMSPSGAYVVVSWDDGPYVFDRDFSHPRRIAAKGEHSDIAVGASGEDVYVSVDYERRGGPVYMVDLRTGKRTDLFPTYLDHTATAMHFSGKAFRKPGWVVMSTYADYRSGSEVQERIGPHFQWLHRRVFAVELREDPKIVGLAFHHGIAAKYFTEPHAVANRDLTRVLFDSNWGRNSETDVDTYMVVVPPAFPNHQR
ncbi:MAG TPA: hypothetical protein VLS49_17260, partial [Usitatibacter sp.]|nr:hypothetical protein [Usitatibacter sp.]